MAKEGKCELIKGYCPRNNDASKGRFCPLWDDYGIPWDQKDNQGQVVAQHRYHCSARSFGPGIMQTMMATNQAAKSAQEARNRVQEGFNRLAQTFQFVGRMKHLKGRSNGQG